MHSASLTDTAQSSLSGEDRNALASADRTLETELAALSSLREALKGSLAVPFARTVELLRGIAGRVIISGIGKSGHIGTKIAASMASTGTPAFFVHASEASHGDLGMITQNDAVVALSWSGETPELASIIAYTRRFKVPLIAITSSTTSALGKAADIVLALPQVTEACPHGLAPTSSTLLQLAIGDALTVALLEARGFTAQDFRVFHPGGKLGASLRLARDIMHKGDAMPLTVEGTRMRDAIVLMTQKGFGVAGVTDQSGKLTGIVTDGDLRRHMSTDFLDKTVDEIMTRRPKSVPGDMLSGAVLEFLNTAAITSIFVVEDGKPAGIIHMHDLLRIGAA